MEKRAPITVHADHEYREKCLAFARKRGVSLAGLIRMLLNREMEQDARESQ